MYSLYIPITDPLPPLLLVTPSQTPSLLEPSLLLRKGEVPYRYQPSLADQTGGSAGRLTGTGAEESSLIFFLKKNQNSQKEFYIKAIAALFIRAKTCKSCNRNTIGKYLNNVWNMHTVQFSARLYKPHSQ